MVKIKWNYDNVKSFVESYDYYLITKESEYINSNSVIEIECHNNHKNTIVFKKFLENPSKCRKCKKYDEVKYFIEIESGSNCKLLSTEYINNKTLLELKCECGIEFKRNFHNFKDLKQFKCKECSNKEVSFKMINKINENNGLTSYEESINFLKNINYTLMDSKDEYKGIRKKSNIKCDNGHIIEMPIDSIKHGHICSICAFENISKENHWNWQGGITPDRNKIMNTLMYKNWRKSVFERDNYTCQCCGDSKGGNLEAHHIKNFSDSEELRFDINNGITLCKKCHNPNQISSFHYIYGTTNNSEEQLKEYINSKIKEVI